MSQLLLRLDRELGEATDPVRRSELLARKACALTRLGYFDEAKALIAELREKHGDWSSGLTHVWIMVAEGLVDWYADLNALAMDRMMRAQVLSVAMRYDVVAAISSAWKAHLEFETSNFVGMFHSLRMSIRHAAHDNYDARARIAIVVCNVLCICGLWDEARKWFSRGRSIALSDGDLASIEALQYNRAAFATAWLRTEQYLGQLTPESIKSVRGELNSARNFQAITNIQTMTNHLSLCEARLCMIEGHFDRAIEGLTAARGTGPFASSNFSQILMDLEIAYCQLKMGRSDYSRPLIADFNMSALIDLDIDDRFVAISMLCELRKLDSGLGENVFFEEQAAEMRAAYLRSRDDLTASLQAFCAEVGEV